MKIFSNRVSLPTTMHIIPLQVFTNLMPPMQNVQFINHVQSFFSDWKMGIFVFDYCQCRRVACGHWLHQDCQDMYRCFARRSGKLHFFPVRQCGTKSSLKPYLSSSLLLGTLLQLINNTEFHSKKNISHSEIRLTKPHTKFEKNWMNGWLDMGNEFLVTLAHGMILEIIVNPSKYACTIISHNKCLTILNSYKWSAPYQMKGNKDPYEIWEHLH